MGLVRAGVMTDSTSAGGDPEEEAATSDRQHEEKRERHKVGWVIRILRK